MTKQRYDLYLNTTHLSLIHAADVVIVEDNAVLQQVGFRYRPEYLAHPNAFSIDPVQLPLKRAETVLHCRGGSPAFIDDYLPDAWGRKVLTRLAFYRDQKKFNANSVIDTLAMLSNSRIGTVRLVEHGQTPEYARGHALERLSQAEKAAQHIDDVDFNAVDIDEMGLLYLANAGTGVGGARPKALLYSDDGTYLAKFNRHTHDSYNNARVELACLLMAKAAGIEIGHGRVIEGVNGREVLLLDRFDFCIHQNQHTFHHLISANGLLKESSSQRDLGGTFRYDNVCELLRQYSISIEKDLKQLLSLMLFNRAINNTDDHERNFSLIHRGEGYELAPAYDLVPSLVTGQYHAAGFETNPYPPLPSEAVTKGKLFGLPKIIVVAAAEQVSDAVSNWKRYAEQAGVSDSDIERISGYLRH